MLFDCGRAMVLTMTAILLWSLSPHSAHAVSFVSITSGDVKDAEGKAVRENKVAAVAGVFDTGYESDGVVTGFDNVDGGTAVGGQFEVFVGDDVSIGGTLLGLDGDIDGHFGDAHLTLHLGNGWAFQVLVPTFKFEQVDDPGDRIEDGFALGTAILKSFRLSDDWSFQYGLTIQGFDGIANDIRTRRSNFYYHQAAFNVRVGDERQWGLDFGTLRQTDLDDSTNYYFGGISYSWDSGKRASIPKPSTRKPGKIAARSRPAAPATASSTKTKGTAQATLGAAVIPSPAPAPYHVQPLPGGRD